MMADGYNAKRRGERFHNSPSNPTAAYPRRKLMWATIYRQTMLSTINVTHFFFIIKYIDHKLNTL